MRWQAPVQLAVGLGALFGFGYISAERFVKAPIEKGVGDTAQAQAIYAEQVFEYPVREGAAVSDIVASFGEMKPDTRDLNRVGSLRTRASELVDIVGYNDGPRR